MLAHHILGDIANATRPVLLAVWLVEHVVHLQHGQTSMCHHLGAGSLGLTLWSFDLLLCPRICSRRRGYLEVLMLLFHFVQLILQNDVVLGLICKHEGHLRTVHSAALSLQCALVVAALPRGSEAMQEHLKMATVALTCVLSSLSASTREATCIIGVSPLPPAIMPAVTIHHSWTHTVAFRERTSVNMCLQ